MPYSVDHCCSSQKEEVTGLNLAVLQLQPCTVLAGNGAAGLSTQVT